MEVYIKNINLYILSVSDCKVKYIIVPSNPKIEINLTRDVHNLYTESYKTLLIETG